jgi:hypothetical protein
MLNKAIIYMFHPVSPFLFEANETLYGRMYPTIAARKLIAVTF